VFFVEPHFFILIEGALVEFIEEGEGSRPIIFFLLFSFFLFIGFADENNLFLFSCCFLLEILGFDVDIIGIEEILVVVFGLLRIFGEELFDFDEICQEFKFLSGLPFEAGEEVSITEAVHGYLG
jgi:hypothetical protein